MAAGGPGDHPLKDILHFNMNVFDSECDAIIRELSTCMSEDALYDSIDWFSTFNMTASRLDEFKRTLSQKLMALKKIADHR
jgi:hypothetical protein